MKGILGEAGDNVVGHQSLDIRSAFLVPELFKQVGLVVIRAKNFLLKSSKSFFFFDFKFTDKHVTVSFNKLFHCHSCSMCSASITPA